MRRRDTIRDTQTFALLFLALGVILATSILVGGLLAIGSLTAGALCALIYDRLKT